MKCPLPSLTGLAIRALVASIAVGFIAVSFAMKDLAPGADRRDGFQLLSADLKDAGVLPEAQVLDGFGRHGGNLSPELHWENAPAGTQSFVVTLYDPDAPTGSGWWHWVVIDLPGSARALPRGLGRAGAALPAGAREMRTDFGRPGYGGAAPPAGEKHRYIFTVHALDVARLDLPDDASAALVGFFVHMHSLGRATLTAHYER